MTGLRIGDAEREQAVAALGEHHAQGRLDVEEHGERLDRAWAARTAEDLVPLFTDLPAPWPEAVARAAAAASGATRAAAWAGAQQAPWTGQWSTAPARPARGSRGLVALLPAPVLAVAAVLLVVGVVAHLPLLLLGLGAWLFVHSRASRRSGCAQRTGRAHPGW